MADIGSLSREILHKIFEHVRGDGFACNLLHVTQVCHLWKATSAPAFYKYILLDSIDDLSTLARTIIHYHTQSADIGAWVRYLDIVCLSDAMSGWEDIYTVLRHTPSLDTLMLGKHTSPSFLAVLSSSCATTMTYLTLEPTPQAMPGLVYISDLHNLTTIDLYAPQSVFQSSYGILPWSLPCLRELYWETAPEDGTITAHFLTQCRLPAISRIDIRTSMLAVSAPHALLQTLQNHPNITHCGCRVQESGYEIIYPALSDNIRSVTVYSPRPSLIEFLSSKISTLWLVCVDVDEDIGYIYHTLDAVLRAQRQDIVIHITFRHRDPSFEWKSATPNTEDLPVGRDKLVRKLLWYAFEGLDIRDDNNDRIKDLLP